VSGPQGMRLVLAVERAHPRRIARNAEEWERCAHVLEDAAERIDAIAARQSDIGGQTGPSMAVAMARASDVLRVKARDLRRGGDALGYIADATLAHQEEKRRLDRDHPDDAAGTHLVWREEGSRKMADSQESALRHGIAVMKSIEVGEDPRSTPITVSAPTPVVTQTPTWWPPDTTTWTDPPLDPSIDPDADLDVQEATPQGPLGSPASPATPVSTGSAPSAPAAPPGGLGPGALAGAALGGAGAVAGARAVASRTPPPSAARGIGAGGTAGSGGVLGGRGGAAGAGGGGGRSGSSGAGATGGRGGRRTRKERREGDRDLHDDGDDWLDDDAGPGVLR
jgi:hypothetical protein